MTLVPFASVFNLYVGDAMGIASTYKLCSALMRIRVIYVLKTTR
jgi:hypothetical protein